MNWNYRIVNLKSENAGQDWYCLREVYYAGKDKPKWHAKPCMGSETVEGFAKSFELMREAFQKPALQEEEFTPQGESKWLK